MARSTRLLRPARGRLIAGVCVALARRFDLSPTLVRVLFVLSCILLAPQVLLYRALADHPLEVATARAIRERRRLSAPKARRSARHRRVTPGPAAASLAVRIDGIANAEIIETGPRSPRADDPGQHVAEAVINGRLAALLVARSPHELTLTHGG